MELSTEINEELVDLVSESGISYLLSAIEPKELGRRYVLFLVDHPDFLTVCAGAKHHHWWYGGLAEHVLEMIQFMLKQLRDFPVAYEGITTSDCIIAAFLHDFDKTWAYVGLTYEQHESGKFKQKQLFTYADNSKGILDGLSKTLLELARAGIVPTDQQWSAVLFAHGGYSDANFGYTGRTKVGDTVNGFNKLAVLLNMADMYSSQILGKSIA
jgi:hypothetical protein